jgi:hypothetical protein
MAGRLERHRGSPPRLGKPEPGAARYLTQGESEATGLTRNCIVLVTYDNETYLLLKNSSGWSEMVEDLEWALQQLTRFWEKK